MASGSAPWSWTACSWWVMSARSTPRRRCVGSTPTQLTPAAGTAAPPGTVSWKEYAVAIPASTPPS
jgi:hypothetical protein